MQCQKSKSLCGIINKNTTEKTLRGHVLLVASLILLGSLLVVNHLVYGQK
jgi:hypothetical protein